MNNNLQKQLLTLEDLIRIQRDSVYDHAPAIQYMHGMLNGLICAHSVISGDTPQYVSRLRKKPSLKIRHKSK